MDLPEQKKLHEYNKKRKEKAMKNNKNKESYLFKVAMAVMAYCVKKEEEDEHYYVEVFGNWCRDMEFTALAYRVYQKLRGREFDEALIARLTQKILDTEDVEKLPHPNNSNDEATICHGVTCGDFLGYPTLSNLVTAHNAIQEFEENMEYHYLAEVFDAHPEWVNKAS